MPTVDPRRQDRAPLPQARPRRPQRRPGRPSSRRRPRPHARLRAHQARRRPAGQAPGQATPSPAAAMHGDKSQGQRERALAELRGRHDPDAGRHRRRRPRHRRRRHHPRHQLRHAGRGRGLRPPRRPHRPRRRHGVGITFVLGEQARRRGMSRGSALTTSWPPPGSAARERRGPRTEPRNRGRSREGRRRRP